MHYGGSRDECKKFQEPYMTIRASGQEIPENKELSSLDIKALKKYYAPPGTGKLYSNWYKLGEFTFKLRYLKFLNLQSFDKILDQ